jgi:hypothetical protein
MDLIIESGDWEYHVEVSEFLPEEQSVISSAPENCFEGEPATVEFTVEDIVGDGLWEDIADSYTLEALVIAECEVRYGY